MNYGAYTSRNSLNNHKKNLNVNYNFCQRKFNGSEENDSVISKDIFNFSPSEQKKVSPIAKEEYSPLKNYMSPQENQVQESPQEQLTPQEIEEYYYLKQKQAELEQRIKEIEFKKLNSGK